MYCKYCGCRMTNLSGMCNPCTEKLMLIRKIRTIVFAIKRDAERERALKSDRDALIASDNERVMVNEQTGNYQHNEKVQRIAS